jgi:hypothetical protein
MKEFLATRWEQIFFGLVGLAFLAFSFYSLWSGDMAGASATFAMAFFSFIYSNISRFKRFKGLGFEAELWEDKQKEAAELIERLKAVVSVYTREVILGKVMSGRWGDGANWHEHWALYDELIARHAELGQDIDFTDTKRRLDGIFIFDAVANKMDQVRKTIWKGKEEARKVIDKEHPQPIKDAAGFGRRINLLNEVPYSVKDPFEVSLNDDLAQHLLRIAEEARSKLHEGFGVQIEYDPEVIEELNEISRLYQAGPLKITDDLIDRLQGKKEA